MDRRALLLDYHGVISDGERLPEEWRRLLGEFFAPRFGGQPEAWADANRVAFRHSLERLRALGPGVDDEEWRRADRIAWLREMFELVGLPPPDDARADEIALEAAAYVIPRTRATAPGAAEALRALHVRGYVLYTASGDHSTSLDGYLRGLGVRELFRETYGSNLLGVAKSGPGFYRALLAHAGIDAGDAVVVDDDAWRLDWARELGMETILVGDEHPAAAHRRVRALAQLPDALG